MRFNVENPLLQIHSKRKFILYIYKLGIFATVMELSWRGIDIEVPNNNKRYRTSRIKLVTNASGTVKSGLLAVMGPSGCGKTTLINAFVGRVVSGSRTTGQMLLNGKERDDIEEWLNSIGYVDQDDTIFEELTAFETVKYAAKFRLKDITLDIDAKVETLFQKMAILHVSKNKMKNLSGGERKRVMIAVELVTDPKIIFLDEPTSGLDNNTGLKIIKLLKELSNEGRTIIFSIHQPDDITADHFDQILLLSQGRTVFMGDFQDCEKYFTENNITKQPKETFSNFAMRVLDVEPGVYYENQENTALDKLVEDVKKRYKIEDFMKVPRSSNDDFANYSFSLNDTLTIYKRKLKIRFINLRNFIIFVIVLLIQGGLAWFVKEYNASITECPSQFIDYKYEIFLRHNPTFKESKSTYKKIFHIIEKCRVRFEIQSFLGIFSTVTIPSGATMTFLPELPQIRREIGINTYSTTSYYIASILYELTSSALPLIVNFICFYFIFGLGFSLIDYLPFIFLFLCALLLFIFIGSISTGPKIANVLGIIAVFLMCTPYTFFINVLKFGDLIKKETKIPCVFNFWPMFPFNVFLIKFAGKRYEDTSYSGIKDVLEKSNIDEWIAKLREIKRDTGLACSFMMDDEYMRKVLTGFDLNPYFSIIFVVCGMFLYIALSMIILAKRIGPSLRMRLHSK